MITKTQHLLPAWTLVYVVLAGILIRCLIIIVYRLKFHPLSRFPGPFLARLTDLYPAYHSFYGQNHIAIQRAHDEYGPMVRMGPNKLSVNTVSGLHQIYTQPFVQKSKGYETMVPVSGAYNLHTAIDKDLHRHKRRVMSQAFSERALRDFEPKIVDAVETFLHRLQQECDHNGWTEPLNTSQIVRYMTIDVLGEFAFGRSFDLQTKEANRFLPDAINAASRIAGVYAQYPRLKDTFLERIVKAKGAWTREKFGNLTLALAQQRLAEKEDARHDLFSFVINAKDPETGKGYELKDIWAESRLFLIAGSDTTATVICATLFYLSRYTACKDRLFDEVRSTFSSADDIRTGPKLSSCRYLRACLDEAMRLSPPASTALWREVCKDGLMVDGAYIPPGVDVGSSLYAVHHLESVFPDSWTYKPERWLDSDEGRLAQQRRAFHPFSLGSRKCIAYAMAYNEAFIFLARLVLSFDFGRPEGDLDSIGAGVPGSTNGRHRPNEFQLEEHLTSTHDGPYLRFCLRNARGKDHM